MVRLAWREGEKWMTSQGVKQGEAMVRVTDPIGVGRKVAELRGAQGLTQEGLARVCNVKAKEVSRLEAGDYDYLTRRYFERMMIVTALLNIDVPHTNVSYEEFRVAWMKKRKARKQARARREARPTEAPQPIPTETAKLIEEQHEQKRVAPAKLDALRAIFERMAVVADMKRERVLSDDSAFSALEALIERGAKLL